MAGKYRLEREIGSGGMGIVFAATHVHLDQTVALKFLLGDSASPEIVERFWREARAVVKIQSEHVARVIDIGDLDGHTPYIVMEYLEGHDLETAVVDDGPLPVEDAVRYILQACEALAEVHAHGIVHRDIKPANLFLTTRADGSPIIKLLDFGISKPAWEAQDGRLTHTSAVIGSPRYMSPEQLRSSRDVDARTDVWSLGVTLFEILAGMSPFATGTMPEVCASILKDQPLPIFEVRPDVPHGLADVIERCLAKKPEQRYADVGELATALGPYGPADSAISAQRAANVLLQVRPSPSGPSRTTGQRAAVAATEYPVALRPRTDTQKAVIKPTFEDTLDEDVEDPTGPDLLESKLSGTHPPIGDEEEPTTPPRASSQIAVPRVSAIEVPTGSAPTATPRTITAALPAPTPKDLEAEYLRKIGPVAQVPHRMMDLARMTALSIDHRAGFLMSRMDGATTLEELLDVSGMSRLETLKLVCELLDHRLIRFEA